MTRSATERFWEKVDKTEGCWEWQGCVGNHGYGLLHFNGVQDLTHRISYRLNVGAIADGLYVLHRCDNRKCVRPDHLFLGTHRDNVDDMIAKGRCRGPSKPGSMNHQAILSEADVIAILARYQRGNGSKLAAEFSVSTSTICGIVNRRSWKHVGAIQSAQAVIKHRMEGPRHAS